MIRILVADDQSVVRAGLRTILESRADLAVVAEAADGVEAVTLAKTLEPDVVMMDIRMPALDGIEATRRLTGATARTRVLVLTTYGIDEYVLSAPARRDSFSRPTRRNASSTRYASSPPETRCSGRERHAASSNASSPDRHRTPPRRRRCTPSPNANSKCCAT
jgi:CheY-like chemotaxis protein